MAPLLFFSLHSRAESSSDATVLIPLLTTLFGVLVLVCLAGLIWCFVRRRKHRAPVIPYHLHTIAPPKDPTASTSSPEQGIIAAGAEGDQAGGGKQAKKQKMKRPPPFGQEGRGVGFGFNPVFKEAYGGGGRVAGGLQGITGERVQPRWG